MSKKENIDIYFDLFITINNKLNEDVCLKGNILLNKLYKEKARATKDLDMDIKVSKMVYREKVIPLLKEFAEDLISRGLADRYRIKNEGNDKTMGGISIYKYEGCNVKDSLIYSADINLGNSIFGDTIYVIEGCEFRGYSIERVICDKIIATLSDKDNRRVKDYYDIYLIREMESNLDYTKIVDYIIQKRGSVESTLTLLKSFPFLEENLMVLKSKWEDFLSTDLKELQVNVIHFSDMFRVYTLLVSKIEQMALEIKTEGELRW